MFAGFPSYVGLNGLKSSSVRNTTTVVPAEDVVGILKNRRNPQRKSSRLSATLRTCFALALPTIRKFLDLTSTKVSAAVDGMVTNRIRREALIPNRDLNTPYIYHEGTLKKQIWITEILKECYRSGDKGRGLSRGFHGLHGLNPRNPRNPRLVPLLLFLCQFVVEIAEELGV